MYVDKQNVVGTTWCQFGRQKWSHFRSQQMRYNRKIREEEELIDGSDDGQKETDSGDIQEVCLCVCVHAHVHTCAPD